MYTTQRQAVDKIREYLATQNLLLWSLEYKKGKRIEVETSKGIMTFQFGDEFKRL